MLNLIIDFINVSLYLQQTKMTPAAYSIFPYHKDQENYRFLTAIRAVNRKSKINFRGTDQLEQLMGLAKLKSLRQQKHISSSCIRRGFT